MAVASTVQEKLKVLTNCGVRPKLGAGNLGGLTGCCGAVGLFGNYDKATAKTGPNYIYHRGINDPDNHIPTPNLSECLLIPDLEGNLQIEWEDK